MTIRNGALLIFASMLICFESTVEFSECKSQIQEDQEVTEKESSENPDTLMANLPDSVSSVAPDSLKSDKTVHPNLFKSLTQPTLLTVLAAGLLLLLFTQRGR